MMAARIEQRSDLKLKGGQEIVVVVVVVVMWQWRARGGGGGRDVAMESVRRWWWLL